MSSTSPRSAAASSAPFWQALKYGMPFFFGIIPIFSLPPEELPPPFEGAGVPPPEPLPEGEVQPASAASTAAARQSPNTGARRIEDSIERQTGKQACI